MNEINKEDVEKLHKKLDTEAKQAGYNLNPDVEFTKALVEGLKEVTGYYTIVWSDSTKPNKLFIINL